MTIFNIQNKDGMMAKIRLGFVSNSSSSSFIIAGKETPRMTIDVDISSLVEYTISNKDELDEYFVDEYSYETIDEIKEDSWVESQYKKCLRELKEGKTIYAGETSSDDDEAYSNLIYFNGFNGEINFDVIKGDQN
jgi:hypothetical protein